MRTRFLATDYSTRATARDSASVGGPVEILDLVRLPVPHLSPSNYPQFSANYPLSFDEIPVFSISREIEKLPFDDALSIFLSDVLPHYVDGANFEEPRIDSCKEKSEVTPTEEKDGTISNEKGENGLKFVQFEIPEMGITLLPPSQLYSVRSNISVKQSEMQEVLNSELTLHNLLEIQQSVYSVDDMSIEYSMDQKYDSLEDADHVKGTLHSQNIKFPLFEVDVESLGILGRIYKADELLSIENLEKQQVAHPDGVISNNEGLLGSIEFDLIKYLLQNCVAMHCIEDKNLPSQLDYVSIVELSCCQEYSTLHQGKSDGDLIWSMEPVLFDEFLFFDLDPYYFCEVLVDSAEEIESESCESLFAEAMNFRSFNELIVCHELTLMDDSFKSLPVPIFSGHGNTCSSHALFKELLAHLDWQPSSASDGLYLDWHFLGEDGSGSVKYSSCWNMVREIDTYEIDAAMNSSDSGKQIFDFILSDCHSHKTNAENYKEILNLSCNDVSVFHSSGEACLSSLRNQGEGEKINEDILLRTGVDKVTAYRESMSSDLEFFLNPRSYNKGREIIPSDKSVDTNTVCQVLVSTDDSADANTTIEVQQNWNFKMHQVSSSTHDIVGERDYEFASAQKEGETKLEELLNIVPVKEIYGNEPVKAVYDNEDFNMMPLEAMPVGLESKQNMSCKPFFPKNVIIVNTRNFNEEMIISRRSTYQRILEMEKEGAQVVERDIGLSVDIIVSSAVCLTWYDCRNIGSKASAPDEAFSCLPLCVESIATSILTSLSVAFSCCILIFEGNFNFLCSIMESSDELYAAAASLGIDIQLHYSYSYEVTEEVIISCISVAAELSRDLYPRMSDSESLAESFLTAFPSINPISAHAILSSDVILGKFFELSNEGRIFALKKYKVPDENVAMLSAISRYGEQEDSKSGLTNCSSSVSVPDSENVEPKIASERKKPKYTRNHYNRDELPDDLFHESLKLLPDDQLNLTKLSVPCNSWLSGSTEMYNKSTQIGSSFNSNLLGHCLDNDVDMMKKSDNKSSLNDFPLTKGFHISDARTQFDIDCSPRWRSATTSKNNFCTLSTKVTGTLQENFAGEVVDLEDTPAFRENFSAGNSTSFSPFALDIEKDYAARNSRMLKRPFSSTDLPLSTITTDDDSVFGTRVSTDKAQILKKEITPHFDTIGRNRSSMTNQNELLGGNMIGKLPQNPYNLSFQDKGTRSLGHTPLSKAVHSTQLQGSPWTIEFLNKIREKSRLRKQSVSYDVTSPCFASSGNTSKFTKRKSPSIFEFYKYEGGSTPQKIVEQKRQKRSSQPLNSSRNKNDSAPCPPSWTPIDKRARRALSFSTNGSGGQSKLVWRDNNLQTTPRRL
ncbi:hypothetical protein OROGR_011070 [Orobanche gracilis]